MNIVNVLLDTPVNHNLEVIGEYLCLFDSAERNRIKFLKLEDGHIDELLAATIPCGPWKLGTGGRLPAHRGVSRTGVGGRSLPRPLPGDV